MKEIEFTEEQREKYNIKFFSGYVFSYEIPNDTKMNFFNCLCRNIENRFQLRELEELPTQFKWNWCCLNVVAIINTFLDSVQIINCYDFENETFDEIQLLPNIDICLLKSRLKYEKHLERVENTFLLDICEKILWWGGDPNHEDFLSKEAISFFMCKEIPYDVEYLKEYYPKVSYRSIFKLKDRLFAIDWEFEPDCYHRTECGCGCIDSGHFKCSQPYEVEKDEIVNHYYPKSKEERKEN